MRSFCVLLGLMLALGVQCARLSVGIEHDLSGPTYGLQGKTSSQMSYDPQHGLNLQGTIKDLLGPPIKVVHGFRDILTGGGMATVGQIQSQQQAAFDGQQQQFGQQAVAFPGGLKSGGNNAMIGIDSRLLETAGNLKLLKGGLLLGGSKAKVLKAGKIAGPPGKLIASVIEMPVKVVALKDIAAGKMLTELAHKHSGGANGKGNDGQQQIAYDGQQQVQQIEQQQQVKGQQQVAYGGQQKGDSLLNKGHALRTSGINQVLEGASEGVHNLNSMMSRTGENLSQAFRLMPIVLDMQAQDAKQEQQQQQQVDAAKGGAHSGGLFRPQTNGAGSMTGGSLFGGLSSLLPSLSQSGASSAGGLFGQQHSEGPAYAAVLRQSNPLTGLFMNPASNPFLVPLGGVGQDRSYSFNYNLLPGVSVKEHGSSPSLGGGLLGSFGGSGGAAKGLQQQQHNEHETKGGQPGKTQHVKQPQEMPIAQVKQPQQLQQPQQPQQTQQPQQLQQPQQVAAQQETASN